MDVGLPPATIEALEDRRLYSAVHSVALKPAGLSPLQVSQAYGFNQASFVRAGKTVVANGAGETIAIVAAFRDPAIAGDLRQFDKQFGISNKAAKGGFALSIATPQGKPPVNADSAQETALDVEWAHAMAPAARILLVETSNDTPVNLFKGVDFARRQRGVTVVSMSFGWDNGPGAGVDYQNILTTPAKHIGGWGRGDGVTFVEAGSDDGVPNAFPGPSVNVVSVGGTTLTVDSSGNYISETALAASAAPATVAYNADPNTGFAVYDSVLDAGVQGWQVAGGTSAGAPQWAAVFAIADQAPLRGKHSLDTASNTLPALASLPAQDFHLITNGAANMGRGSPIANKLIADLVDL